MSASGWIVGWGLYLDEDGWLVMREDAHVFPSLWKAIYASCLLPFFFPFFWGWPRKAG